jgi:hypothetical protein
MWRRETYVDAGKWTQISRSSSQYPVTTSVELLEAKTNIFTSWTTMLLKEDPEPCTYDLWNKHLII